VSADERVELLPTGILEGNIQAPRIVISEGARFTGRIDMSGRADALPPSG
jgi:cytoskeletal protein CcmA (bactofilin family)